MVDEKKQSEKPSDGKINTDAASKVLTYHGPVPVPSIGNLPGLPAFRTKLANLLTPEEREHVIRTVPGAANWWR